MGDNRYPQRLAQLRIATLPRPIVFGSAWSLLAQASSKLSIALGTLVAARMLGVEDFGFFAALQAAALIAASLWDFGVSRMLMRETAAGTVSLRPVLRRAFITRLWLSPIWLFVYGGGAYLLGGQTEGRLWATILIGVAGMSFAFSMVLDGGLQAHLRFRHAALALSAGRVVFAAGAILIGAFKLEEVALPALATSFLLGELATLLLLLLATRSLLSTDGDDDPIGLAASSRLSLRRSLPYALNSFMGLVYNRGDVILVWLLAGTVQAGLYAPASRIQDALALLPAVAVAGLIPAAASVNSSSGMRRSMLVASMGLSLGLAIPATVATFLLLPALLTALLGESFALALDPSRVLIWAIPFAAAQAPLLSILVAVGRAHDTTLVYASSLCVSLLGHLALDPRFGAVGGAWASFIRDPIALLVVLVIFYRRKRNGMDRRLGSDPVRSHGS
jgi:O-antigen/teichoic acid export membrane protein